MSCENDLQFFGLSIRYGNRDNEIWFELPNFDMILFLKPCFVNCKFEYFFVHHRNKSLQNSNTFVLRISQVIFIWEPSNVVGRSSCCGHSSFSVNITRSFIVRFSEGNRMGNGIRSYIGKFCTLNFIEPILNEQTKNRQRSPARNILTLLTVLLLQVDCSEPKYLTKVREICYF